MTTKKSRAIANKHGQLAERKALEYLKRNGLKPVTTNYNSPCGEIDIIMYDKNFIVFIEVKFRKNNNFINPLEAIDRHKCDKIIATSQYFQQGNHKVSKMMSRFDVIILSGNINNPKIEWIKNAFQA